MEIIFIIKVVLLAASYTTLVLSIIFLFFPALYVRLDSLLNKDIIYSLELLTSLEGEIDLLNDWIFQHRKPFGVLFILLSLYNIKCLIFL